MNPAKIIQTAMDEGLDIALSPGGQIKATGEQSVVNHWLSILRENKAEIVKYLARISAEQATPLPLCCRATSYPCGKCGGKYYTQNQDGWQCDGCAVVFKIIGGTRGPEIIH